ncbi:MAG: hypothetical protein E6G27_02165 [Actinobacteria bacterium]|nr:MAG: hypothetical protein E6G27_02165 [Actinomycetota bacterium]
MSLAHLGHLSPRGLIERSHDTALGGHVEAAQPGVEGEHVGTPTRVEALEDPARVDLHDEEAVVDVTGHEGPPRHRIEVQAVALVAAG